MAKRKSPAFRAAKEIRAIARERVGTVKPEKVIIPKSERKPKHPKKPLDEAAEQG